MQMNKNKKNIIIILFLYCASLIVCYYNTATYRQNNNGAITNYSKGVIDSSFSIIALDRINKSNQQLFDQNKHFLEINKDNHSYNSNFNIEQFNKQCIGSYIITAYTWTGNTMANGEYPYVGCAASSDFPIGTTLYIEGVGTYVVNDVCPTSGVIDIYMNSYDDCITFGRRNAQVYILTKGE